MRHVSWARWGISTTTPTSAERGLQIRSPEVWEGQSIRLAPFTYEFGRSGRFTRYLTDMGYYFSDVLTDR